VGEWLIVVEVKSGEPGLRSDHAAAEADVRSYMTTNAVPHSDIVGIAIDEGPASGCDECASASSRGRSTPRRVFTVSLREFSRLLL
jgi:hypothetical protein